MRGRDITYSIPSDSSETAAASKDGRGGASVCTRGSLYCLGGLVYSLVDPARPRPEKEESARAERGPFIDAVGDTPPSLDPGHGPWYDEPAPNELPARYDRDGSSD